jgi:putative ABC transport system ATP-binding protein
MSRPVIEISELSYAYNVADERQILQNISLEISAGQLVIITGPSGSGKTTLLTIMGALRSATQGSVRVLGQDLSACTLVPSRFKKKPPLSSAAMGLRQKIGFIFQNHNLIKALTAQYNVEMALELDGLTASERASRAHVILKRLGLGQHTQAYPAHLSGGQRQRVAIARALVRSPALVLADEPTASLDFQSSLEVISCLKEAAGIWGTSTIMVTHDQRLMAHADRIIRLEDGVIVAKS